MDGVGPDDYGRTFAPILLFATDRHFSVNGNDDLDRMVSMGWNNAVRASDEKESTFP
jgi:hypothetical protein